MSRTPLGCLLGLLAFVAIGCSSEAQEEVGAVEDALAASWAKPLCDTGRAPRADFDAATLSAADEAGNLALVKGVRARVTFAPGATVTGPALVLTKYDANGDLAWPVKKLDPKLTIQAVAAGRLGEVVIAGSFVESADLLGQRLEMPQGAANALFVAKLDGTGKVLYARAFRAQGVIVDATDPSSGNFVQVVQSVAIDPNGNVAVTGGFVGELSFGGAALKSEKQASPDGTGAPGYYPMPPDRFVAKLDAAGQHVFSKRIGRREPRPEGKSFRDGLVTFDRGGNLVLAGSFEDTMDFGVGAPLSVVAAAGPDLFVAKLGPSGNVLFAKQFGGEGYDSIWSATASAADGSIVLGGSFGVFGGKAIRFGALRAANTASWTTEGGYVAKLDASGTPRWLASLTSSEAASVGSVAVHADGRVVAIGSFDRDLTVAGGGTLRDGVTMRHPFYAEWSSTGAPRALTALDTRAHFQVSTRPTGALLLVGAQYEGPLSGDLGTGALSCPGVQASSPVVVARLPASMLPPKAAAETPDSCFDVVPAHGCGFRTIWGTYESPTQFSAVTDGTSYYYVTYTSLVRVPAHGGAATTLLTSTEADGYLSGLVVDGARLVFMRGTNLVAMPVGGGPLTVLAQGLTVLPDGAPLAADASGIYLTDASPTASPELAGSGVVLKRLPRDGSALQTLATASYPISALTVAGGIVYATTHDGQVLKLETNGFRTLATAPGGSLNYIVAAGGDLYVSGNGGFGRVPAAGGPAKWFENGSKAAVFGVAASETHVYYSLSDYSGVRSGIYKQPIAGGPAERIDAGDAFGFGSVLLVGDAAAFAGYSRIRIGAR